MKPIEELVILSKYAGERFDLIQAGGGNTSVKTEGGELLIKASGFHLSELDIDKGVVITDNQKVINIIKNAFSSDKIREEIEKETAELLKGAIITENLRPSIETYLHALTYKYTLHTHPICVNAICCRKNWDKVLAEHFPDALFVEYDTPGIELALSLYDALMTYEHENGHRPSITFLQNHGLIISSNSLDKTIAINEMVIEILSDIVNGDLADYKLTNSISRLINESLDIKNVSYLSQDKVINELIKTNKEIFFTHPFCPDKMVYCGISALELNNLNDSLQITDYINKYDDLPRILIWNDLVFMNAENVKKAMEIQEVFKFHLMSHVVCENSSEINYLSNKELNYLSNWEAEKYRKKL
jgi:rhamnose utilization protein RhaD (predicted bifunctional aldolase and dehydrogenase)